MPDGIGRPPKFSTAEYHSGYLRGHRRRLRGDEIGADDERRLWLGLHDDPLDAAYARGYRDGLSGHLPRPPR